MATIIVEDGSGVANANSYVSEAELTTFAGNRNITLVGDTSELLIQAMDYIESLSYKGIKKERDQALQWPRTGVYIDGYYEDSDTIPEELKNALMQCAIAVDQGEDPLQNTPRNIKRKKVGPLEIEYSDSAASVEINNKIRATLWKLLRGGYGGNVLNVSKG